MELDLSVSVTQAVFAGITGLAQPDVSRLLAAGVLREGAPVGEWLQAYCRHLRDAAHGRGGAVGESRRRVLDAQAERLELENRLRAGELASVADIKRAAATIAAAMATDCDTLAARLAPRLLGQPLHELMRLVDAEQREMRLRWCALARRDASPAGTAAAVIANGPADGRG